jgi:hypothetical protein
MDVTAQQATDAMGLLVMDERGIQVGSNSEEAEELDEEKLVHLLVDWVLRALEGLVLVG